jgi:hypothetical protein
MFASALTNAFIALKFSLATWALVMPIFAIVSVRQTRVANAEKEADELRDRSPIEVLRERNPVDFMHRRSDALAQRAADLKKLADACREHSALR